MLTGPTAVPYPVTVNRFVYSSLTTVNWVGIAGDDFHRNVPHFRIISVKIYKVLPKKSTVEGWCSGPWTTKSHIQLFYSYVVLNSPRRGPTPYPGQGIHGYTSTVSWVVLNTAKNTKQTIWGWHGDPWGATRAPRGPPDRPRGTLKLTLYSDRTELEAHHRLIAKV